MAWKINNLNSRQTGRDLVVRQEPAEKDEQQQQQHKDTKIQKEEKGC
jgi:hypothetical protein